MLNTPTGDPEKPTKQSNDDLSEVMGQLSVNSDKTSTPPKNLSDMPIDIVALIIERSDYKQQIILRKVSKSFRALVDKQKPTLTRLKIYCKQDLIICNYNDRCVAYVSPGWSSSESPYYVEYIDTIITNDDYEQVAFDDLALNLKNPKLKLKGFSFDSEEKIDVHDDSGSFDSKFHRKFKSMENILKSRNHQLFVKTCAINIPNPSNALSILPYLKLRVLEKITILRDKNGPGWIYSAEAMQKVALLEQWKQAEMLKLTSGFPEFLIQHVTHFKRFEINENILMLSRCVKLEIQKMATNYTERPIAARTELMRDVVTWKYRDKSNGFESMTREEYRLLFAEISKALKTEDYYKSLQEVLLENRASINVCVHGSHAPSVENPFDEKSVDPMNFISWFEQYSNGIVSTDYSNTFNYKQPTFMSIPIEIVGQIMDELVDLVSNETSDTSTGDPGKPMEHSSEDLSEIMGQLSVTTDDSDKTSPSLSDMPIDVVGLIIERSEYKEQLKLRKVSKSLRALVDNQKPALSSLHISNEIGSLKIRFNDLTVCYSTWHSLSELSERRTRVYTENDFETVAFDDLAFTLRNPKLQLETFSVEYGSVFTMMEFYKKICSVLNSIEHKVSVKTFEIMIERKDLLCNLLPYLKPGVLEKIKVRGLIPENEFEREDYIETMKEIKVLEQWKQATSFELVTSYNLIVMEHAKHFKRFRFNEYRVDDRLLIRIRNYLSKLHNFEYCLISTKLLVDAENLRSEVGRPAAPNQRSKYVSHYSIPDSNDYLEIVFFKYGIVIQKIKNHS